MTQGVLSLPSLLFLYRLNQKKDLISIKINTCINVPRTQQIVSERNLPIIKTIEKQSSVFLPPS